jgi:peptide/nickel transport system ATP-binding protein
VTEQPLLEVRDLRVSFGTAGGPVRAVDGVSFSVGPGEILAVVGESGSGKSVTATTLTGLTRAQGATISGSVRYRGRELTDASDAELRRVRGAGIAMIFQDPMTALNPVLRVGGQIVEQIQAHEPMTAARARERAIELLERVGIPNPVERFGAYPHELSGGMRQRVMIAMAMSCSPSVLIADEPTTALDVTIQAQILEQIRALQTETGAGVVIITHDLGIVADVADRVAVMYAGRIVEDGTLDEVFYDPQHPYTWGLLGSITRVDQPRPARLPAIGGQPPSLLDLPQGCHFRSRCPHAHDACATSPELAPRAGASGHQDRCWLAPDEKRRRRETGGRIGLAAVAPTASTRAGDERGEPVLEVEHLEQHFGLRRAGMSRGRRVHAVDDVTLTLRAGRTLGLVGESGCGKSTLARALVRLSEPSGGTLRFRGADVTRAGRRDLRGLRGEVQMVFQDPYASLNPRKRVGQIIAAPLLRRGVARPEAERRVRELLEQVGLGAEHLDRYPHEFSGGQRQRIGLARALAVRPQLVLLDEPVSALDVSIQAQIVNLLDDLQQELGLAYLFVAHDLAVVRHVSDVIAVMYLGKVVEVSPAEELYERPIHHYTSALLAAIPVPDPRRSRARRRAVVEGEVPSPTDPPRGCRFHPRCAAATEVCRTVEPPLTAYGNGHLAACHHPRSVDAQEIAAAERSPASPLSAGEQLPAPAR